MKILVDADALVALAKIDDANHKKAFQIAQKIKNASLYITPFTIPEVVTVLSYTTSQKAAILFLKEVRKKKIIELSINKEIIFLTDELFFQQSKKGTSWIDCLNVVMVKFYHLDKIFSFDKFYQKFNLLLK
jgi:predicted nucleic acid-binding protein